MHHLPLGATLIGALALAGCKESATPCENLDAAEPPDAGAGAADAAPPDAAAPPDGMVAFSYLLIRNDNGNQVAATSCGAVTPAAVTGVRFLAGMDLNTNFVLDNNEVVAMAESTCNQLDADNSGILTLPELGQFSTMGIPAGIYGLFAIEFLGAGGPLPWQAFDSNADASRITFPSGLTVFESPTPTLVDFSGSGQLGTELQAFFGF